MCQSHMLQSLWFVLSPPMLILSGIWFSSSMVLTVLGVCWVCSECVLLPAGRVSSCVLICDLHVLSPEITWREGYRLLSPFLQRFSKALAS